MSARLRGIARQTVEVIEDGAYTAAGGRRVEIGEQIRQAVAGTRVHGPEPVAVPA